MDQYENNDHLPAGVVQVGETLGGRYSNRVRAAGHVLAADEPVELGGGDTGPNAYEYLLGALGACTSITLRMYAERKNWPLKRVKVQLSQRKVHAEDCADCEQRDGHITEITREIHLEGALSEEQRVRLMEIADKCPVHRILTGQIKVRTRLS